MADEKACDGPKKSTKLFPTNLFEDAELDDSLVGIFTSNTACPIIADTCMESDDVSDANVVQGCNDRASSALLDQTNADKSFADNISMYLINCEMIPPGNQHCDGTITCNGNDNGNNIASSSESMLLASGGDITDSLQDSASDQPRNNCVLPSTSQEDTTNASLLDNLDADGVPSESVLETENLTPGETSEERREEEGAVAAALRPRRVILKRRYRFSSDSTSSSSSNDDDDQRQERDGWDVDTSSSHSTVDHDENLRSGEGQTTEQDTRISGAASSRALHSEPSAEEHTFPRDTWRPLLELRRRELGFTASTLLRRHSSTAILQTNFQLCAGSSVNLARRLSLACRYEPHSGCVNALHFNESGTLIASGSDDLRVVIWDWIHSKPSFSFNSGHRTNVFQAKFIPFTNNSHIITSARDGQVRLKLLSTASDSCNVQYGDRSSAATSNSVVTGSKKLAQHKGAAHKVALLNDSSHVIYSCGEDAVTYRIDLREDKPTKCYTCKEETVKIPLYSIHANPLNSYEHIVGGRDQYIRVYDARCMDGEESDASLVKKFCPHHLVGGQSRQKSHLTCVVYNYNGTEILGTYNDEDIYLFDNSHSDGSEYIHKYTGHRNSATVKGVNFYGPRSEYIVSGSDCGNVFLWDRESEDIVNYFHADDGGVVNVLEPHPHLPFLATSGLDSDIKLWMPVATEMNSMPNLKRITKKNKKDRDKDRCMPQVIDSRMLWFLMQSLRRSAARRERTGTAEGARISNPSSTTSSSSSSGRSSPATLETFDNLLRGNEARDENSSGAGADRGDSNPDRDADDSDEPGSHVQCSAS